MVSQGGTIDWPISFEKLVEHRFGNPTSWIFQNRFDIKYSLFSSCVLTIGHQELDVAQPGFLVPNPTSLPPSYFASDRFILWTAILKHLYSRKSNTLSRRWAVSSASTWSPSSDRGSRDAQVYLGAWVCWAEWEIESYEDHEIGINRMLWGYSQWALGISMQGEWVEHERRSWGVGKNLFLPVILPLYPGPVLLGAHWLGAWRCKPQQAGRDLKSLHFSFIRKVSLLFLFSTA